MLQLFSVRDQGLAAVISLFLHPIALPNVRTHLILFLKSLLFNRAKGWLCYFLFESILFVQIFDGAVTIRPKFFLQFVFEFLNEERFLVNAGEGDVGEEIEVWQSIWAIFGVGWDGGLNCFLFEVKYSFELIVLQQFLVFLMQAHHLVESLVENDGPLRVILILCYQLTHLLLGRSIIALLHQFSLPIEGTLLQDRRRTVSLLCIVNNIQVKHSLMLSMWQNHSDVVNLLLILVIFAPRISQGVECMGQFVALVRVRRLGMRCEAEVNRILTFIARIIWKMGLTNCFCGSGYKLVKMREGRRKSSPTLQLNKWCF